MLIISLNKPNKPIKEIEKIIVQTSWLFGALLKKKNTILVCSETPKSREGIWTITTVLGEFSWIKTPWLKGYLFLMLKSKEEKKKRKGGKSVQKIPPHLIVWSGLVVWQIKYFRSYQVRCSSEKAKTWIRLTMPAFAEGKSKGKRNNLVKLMWL